jgi:hypothetical protein
MKQNYSETVTHEDYFNTEERPFHTRNIGQQF